MWATREVVPARLRTAAEQIQQAVGGDPQIRAAWLEGSLARGTADDWSDLDLHLLVNDGVTFDAIAWMEDLRTYVLADEIPGLTKSFIFVTSDWVHIDLIVHHLNDPIARGVSRLVLHDSEDLLPIGPADEHFVDNVAPHFPGQQVRIFLYSMGIVVAAVHRGDWITESRITLDMRDSLVLLMLAENGVAVPPGRKGMERLLSADQSIELRQLPPIGFDESELRAAQIAISGAFLTRARLLAAQSGAEWPEALCAASVQLWVDELEVDLKA